MTLSQPSAKSTSRCGSSLWSFLDTLAYPTLIDSLSQKPHRRYKSGLRNRDGV